MPLESADQILARAVDGGYAVGYFESWSLDSLQAVVDAAEQSQSPVIIGFNGEFLARPDRRANERLEWYAELGKAAAETALVPCALIFNECSDDRWVRRAVTMGFNLVMPVAQESETLKCYQSRVAAIVAYAHAHEVSVEAEMGVLPWGIPGDSGHAPGMASDPQQAADFVAATGVDLLAVSAGNVHVKIEGQNDLDLSLLAQINEVAQVPLVLHGGTGISPDSLRQAITCGVAKVNYGTILKQRYLKTILDRLQMADEPNPHALLGNGGENDLLVLGRLAVRDAVLEKMELLGCSGKA